MKNPFYVTTPIYYVNAKPHLGHAYTTILVDVMRRCHQVLGDATYFLTGTDEHGDKIAKAAAEQGLSPLGLADRNSQAFRDLLPVIGVEPDDFIRTTEARHKKVVRDLLQKVYDRGDIYFAEYTGKYCVGCERFYADDELVDGKCSDHQTVPDLISEKNYFFRMSKYWENLKNHIHANPDFITANYRNEVLGLLSHDPQDLCISRPKSRLTWGIELPFDKDFVTYVWFDALINYVSALNYPDGSQFHDLWPRAHHVIAKDILKPHCIYWPTMLMSMGLQLPQKIAIHGYWLMNEAKMSKSHGNNVDPIQYCHEFSSDVFRYFLVRNMIFGRDATFSRDEFIQVCNADLSNNLGNLYARVVGLCGKYCDGRIPELGHLPEADGIRQAGVELDSRLIPLIEGWELHRYVESILEYSSKVNKFLDETKPWILGKDPAQHPRLAVVLRNALEGIRIIYQWLWPVIPVASTKVISELGLSWTNPSELLPSGQRWDKLVSGTKLAAQPTGFARIETKK